MRFRFLYWLMGKFTPPTTFEEKTLDGLSLQEAKALACILAYWLAAESVSLKLSRTEVDLVPLFKAKRAWIAVGKKWIGDHPEFATPAEGDGLPVWELFEVRR